MQEKSKLLWLKLLILLLSLALALVRASVDQDSRNIHISDSNVVIYYGHQQEISPRAFIEPGYEISTQGGQTARMRGCPSRDCEIVAVLPDGSVIHVLGFAHGESIGGSDIWFQVEHNSRTGFVFGKLVQAIDNIA